MKKSIILFAGLILLVNLNAQQTFTINQGTGDTFDPVTLSVNQGDIIHFNLTPPHDVVQVSLATWNANGSTPLAGGFVFPTGSGNYTTTTPGVIYYVCSAHISLGMKGSITVNAITAINDIHNNSGTNLFPDPATDIINYQRKDKTEIQEIRIIDLAGKAVKILLKPEISDNYIKIDIQDLGKGIYFIIVKSGTGIESLKFLKS
jgi:plastocyanin